MAAGIRKLYYSIGEVSKLTGLEQHVLRYWETEFPELKPQKNRAGRRIYTEADVAFIQRIRRLLREEKYTIEGARKALAQEEHTPDHKEAFRKELLALREFLYDLKKRL
ncbi:MAG: MerR family transcriptional regulator [Rhodothermales bacterium]|nr:MerR family transcriptional regulator [Rhodothermales bacterium]